MAACASAMIQAIKLQSGPRPGPPIYTYGKGISACSTASEMASSSTCPVEITTEILEDILKEPVQSFTTTSGCLSGDNICSDLQSINVDLKSSGSSPCHLIYKGLPTNPAQRYFTIASGMFWTERIFYSDIIPDIHGILHKMHSPEAAASFMSIFPKYISGFNDDKSDYICLEDVRAQGYKMADKVAGLSWAETQLALETMAKFHAYSYFWVTHKPKDLWESSDLQRFNKKHWIAENKLQDEDAIKKFLKTHYQNCIDLLKAESKSSDIKYIAERMARPELTSDPQKVMARTTNATGVLARYFPLLIHSDLWVNNMLFKYDEESGRPVSAKFIDFQQVRKGNVFEDLLYFVYTSTTPEMRRQHSIEEMLEVYYSTSAKELDELQVPLPAGFSKELLLVDFKENLLAIFMFSCFFVAMQLGKPETEDEPREEDYSVEMIKKYKGSPVAIQRLEELAREAVDLGII